MRQQPCASHTEDLDKTKHVAMFRTLLGLPNSIGMVIKMG